MDPRVANHHDHLLGGRGPARHLDYVSRLEERPSAAFHILPIPIRRKNKLRPLIPHTPNGATHRIPLKHSTRIGA